MIRRKYKHNLETIDSRRVAKHGIDVDHFPDTLDKQDKSRKSKYISSVLASKFNN